MLDEDSALSYLKGPSSCHRRTQNISPDSRVDIPVGSREPARGHSGPCSSTRPRGVTCLRPQMLGRLPAPGTPALVPAISSVACLIPRCPSHVIVSPTWSFPSKMLLEVFEDGPSKAHSFALSDTIADALSARLQLHGRLAGT